METRLGTLSKGNGDTQIDFHDHLTDDELKHLRECIAEIKNIQANKRLWDMINLNRESFVSYIEEVLNELKSDPISFNTVERSKGTRYSVNINRHFLNYLAMVRTFIDHSSKFVSGKFGKESKQVEDFKLFLSKVFDESFAYRFFYKLRNYSQHCLLPLDQISYSAEHNQDGSISGHLKVLFDPKELLSKYTEWGPVKKDLLSIDNKFNIIPLLAEEQRCLDQIWMMVDILNSDNIRNAAIYIKNKTDHFNQSEVEIAIFTNITYSGDAIKSHGIEFIPMDIVNRLNV